MTVAALSDVSDDRRFQLSTSRNPRAGVDTTTAYRTSLALIRVRLTRFLQRSTEHETILIMSTL